MSQTLLWEDHGELGGLEETARGSEALWETYKMMGRTAIQKR
jgi:hypothetical protein